MRYKRILYSSSLPLSLKRGRVGDLQEIISSINSKHYYTAVEIVLKIKPRYMIAIRRFYS
jgi:hypothetical protein